MYFIAAYFIYAVYVVDRKLVKKLEKYYKYTVDYMVSDR